MPSKKQKKPNSQDSNISKKKESQTGSYLAIGFICVFGLILSYSALQYFTPKQPKPWKQYQQSQEQLELELDEQVYPANKNYLYKIKQQYERKTDKFTQGFGFWNDTTLLECTGLNGQSHIKLIDLETQQDLNSVSIPDKYFGEGCEWVDKYNEVTQQYERYVYYLTWRAKVCLRFKYSNGNLEFMDSIKYPPQLKEGWGMLKYQDPKDQKLYFLVTDGSTELHYLDIDTFKIVKTVEIYKLEKRKSTDTPRRVPVRNLNEIELYKDNTLLVNQFMTHYIYIVNLETGEAVQQLDFQKLNSEIDTKMGIKNYYRTGGGLCLNGIAYDQQRDILLITGKKWPIVYEIELFKNQ